MSKTLFVNFRDGGFWAFDVVSAVFLKHLIDVANMTTTLSSFTRRTARPSDSTPRNTARSAGTSATPG
jgi:hypothetical protein